MPEHFCNDKSLYLGIDVGSTTVKAVVTDERGVIRWQDYRRHNARQTAVARDFIHEIAQRFTDNRFRIFSTGSGGRKLADLLGADHIQEVNAVTLALEKLHPQAGSAIELGGQDAKVIIKKEDDTGRQATLTFMNDKCAGGTGATIDRILSKFDLDTSRAGELASSGTVHHISAKCGVFAETDVVGLLKAGVPDTDIFVSLCAAIVKQNLEVLVHGQILKDQVILLGGPNSYFKCLPQLWRQAIPKTWEAHGWTPAEKHLDELIFVPENSLYYAALGSILFGRGQSGAKEEVSTGELQGKAEALNRYLSHGRFAHIRTSSGTLPPVFESEEERSQFAASYALPHFAPPNPEPGTEINLYLGIDGGSTSTKLALIDDRGTLVYKDYVLSGGNPIVDARAMFARIARWRDEHQLKLNLSGVGVTGYASAILKEAFNLDLAVVETVAHMRSATRYYGEVDIVCDIGGQDIKVILMKHGRVVHFKLNTQCSAGNGYFLQSMADQFDVPVSQYADFAARAEKAPSFNYGCAVFMEQDKVSFQQQGWSKEEIMAGLAHVLPLNIWNYVVGEPNIGRLGTRILLQGGTQKNLAAVKTQVDHIKTKVPEARVMVHQYADIAGAIGAAVEAMENRVDKTSSFIGFDQARDLEFTITTDDTARCRFCTNKCRRTFIDIKAPSGREARHISGFGCDKGASLNVDEMKKAERTKAELKRRVPNLVELASKLVFDDYPGAPLPEAGSRLTEQVGFIVSPPGRNKTSGHERFGRSSDDAARRRAEMVIGLPKLLNLYYYAPFFNAYFRSLGVGKVVFSDYTSSTLWEKGNKWGAIDPCFPAKVAPAHVFNLIIEKKVTHVCFPIITHLHSDVVNTLGNTACAIQMGTPEVVDAAFTKHRDLFEENDVTYFKPLVNMERPKQTAGELYEYFKNALEITEHENAWAVAEGLRANNAYLTKLRNEGQKTLNQLVENQQIGLLVIGHPYHHDPGLNHGIPEQFQLRGFPVLCIESLPVSDEFLSPLLNNSPESSSDKRVGPFDIRKVWTRNFNRNTNHKVWAARVAARHPNLAVLDLSSFKCGHDAPTYSYVDNTLEATATPHFLFHDLDQNKPSATHAIRIQTIEYFLRLEEQRLAERDTAGGKHRR